MGPQASCGERRSARERPQHAALGFAGRTLGGHALRAARMRALVAGEERMAALEGCHRAPDEPPALPGLPSRPPRAPRRLAPLEPARPAAATSDGIGRLRRAFHRGRCTFSGGRAAETPFP